MKEAIHKAVKEIWHQALSWSYDEGEYQPTEDEAYQKSVDAVRAALLTMLPPEKDLKYGEIAEGWNDYRRAALEVLTPKK